MILTRYYQRNLIIAALLCGMLMLSGCNALRGAVAGAAAGAAGSAAASAVSGRSGDDIMRDAGVGAVGGAAAGFVYSLF